MRWLFLKPLRPYIVLAALASLLLNLALVVPSLYMLQVFDRVFASRSIETLVMLGLFTLLALGLAVCMDRGRAMLLARAGQAIDDALAAAALAATLHATAQGRAPGSAASLEDIARMRQFLAGPAVQALFDAPWLPVYLAVIFLLHPALGVAAVLAALALLALGMVSERLLHEDAAQEATHRQASMRLVDAMAHQAEVLVGLRMVGHAIARWRQVHSEVQQAQQRLGASAATLSALGRGLRQGVQSAMLALGAGLVVAGHASPGIMIAATLLVGRALQPVEHLVAGWKALLEVRAAWARLQRQPVELPSEGAVQLPAVRGALSLERVSLLADPQRPPVVKGVSLHLEPGECLGVVGPSGSGKTSLLRLMLGLRQPLAGAVRLDGIELAHWPAAQLDGAIGYLPQEVALFAGTVAQNIARLGPLDSPAVMAAARLAGVHELIARLPQGYETELGDGGAALSGGQRQRIGLARAVYGQPRLVVLDEPNAHLDAEGEEALAAALAALRTQGTTVVLVSHRPTLMRHVDRLAVMRDGLLDAIGPRDEVLARLAGAQVHPLRRPAAAAARPTPTPAASQAPAFAAQGAQA